MFRPAPYYRASGLSASQSAYFFVRGTCEVGPVNFPVAHSVARRTLAQTIARELARRGIVAFVQRDVTGLSRAEFRDLTAPESSQLAAA